MVEEWGIAPVGLPVLRVVLSSGQLNASVMSLGASLVDLRLTDHPAPLVLGFSAPSIYAHDTHYVGAIVGRVANRLARARFSLDGKTYRVDANEGENCLHGGRGGFNTRNWTLDASGEDFATFSLVSEDGEMGFPGTVRATCRYQITPDNTLEICLRTTTDAPTLCALASHAYFNLADGGATSIDAHTLQVHATRYLKTDRWDLPTGEIADVDGTRFDVTGAQTIGSRKMDHNFCLSDSPRDVCHVATLSAPNGPSMTVHTSEPGLQVYTGDYLVDAPTGIDGIVYRTRSGLCLESQIWPDSARHTHFPSARLDPGEIRKQVTRLRFS